MTCVYADRTIGRDRHHRDPDGDLDAGVESGPGAGPPTEEGQKELLEFRKGVWGKAGR